MDRIWSRHGPDIEKAQAGHEGGMGKKYRIGQAGRPCRQDSPMNIQANIETNHRTMKRIYYILAGISVLSLLSCHSGSKTHEEPQTVKLDTVMSDNDRTSLQYPGKVKAAQDVSLAFRVSGTIRKIHVEDGARVHAGQLLAELDPTDYQVQLDATEAEYRQIKAEAERVMALYKENGTTPNANDKAVYGLKQITAKYQHHKDQLEYTRLYAPFGGIIQKRLFEAHETIGAGMPVVSMISNGTPEVEINLPAAEYIRRGQFSRYHCAFDIYPGEVYPLEFISITPKANANQLYTMRLRFRLPDGEKRLPAAGKPLPSPGMNTMVTICCDADGVHSLSVPSSAIWQKEGKTKVFVYDPDEKAVRSREVTVVRLLGNGRCIVTSDNLKAGELVVSAGVHHIEEGEYVKPLPPVTQTNIGGLL